MSRLIVVSLDGFNTSSIGCYGSSWNQTATLDRLASTGVVWDRWTATSDDTIEMFRDWTADSTCFDEWRLRGNVELVTDDERVFSDLADTWFDDACLLDTDIGGTDLDSGTPCDDVEATQFAQLVAAAIQRDAENPDWSVLWFHSRFLTQCWDAPRSLLEIDEPDEPLQPSEEVELLEYGDTSGEQHESIAAVFEDLRPPSIRLTDESHPDLVTSWMRTYGCQIRLVDELLAVLLGCLVSENDTVLVTGTSGFSLGQNGAISADDGPLRSCHIRLPLIVSNRGPVRVPQLTSAAALPDILRRLGSEQTPLIRLNEWCESQGEFQPAVTTKSTRVRKAITTPKWFCVEDNNGQGSLYLKPDDIEDINNVSTLRPDVVEKFV